MARRTPKKQMYVHPDFLKKVKVEAAKKNKSMLEITKDMAYKDHKIELNTNKTKKKKKDGGFYFRL